MIISDVIILPGYERVVFFNLLQKDKKYPELLYYVNKLNEKEKENQLEINNVSKRIRQLVGSNKKWFNNQAKPNPVSFLPIVSEKEIEDLSTITRFKKYFREEEVRSLFKSNVDINLKNSYMSTISVLNRLKPLLDKNSLELYILDMNIIDEKDMALFFISQVR